MQRVLRFLLGISASTFTGHGLDHCRIGVRFLVRSVPHSVQSWSDLQLASYLTGTVGNRSVHFFSIYLILPALESTQPLTEMSARNIPGDKALPARKAENLIDLRADGLENMGSSTSHNPIGPTTCYKDSSTFLFTLLAVKNLHVRINPSKSEN
jgi:hypothetical protein